jgi:hypothetical protein
LSGFRVVFWEHLGLASFSPLHPNPCSMDLTQTCVYGSTSLDRPLLDTPSLP